MGPSGRILWTFALTLHFGTIAAQKPIGTEDRLVQTVYLYDFVGVPAIVLADARTEVAQIFFDVDVDIEWLNCPTILDDVGRLNQCPAPPPGTIELRVVPSTLNFISGAALGFAAMSKQGGVVATISYPRIQQCADNQTRSAASLDQILSHAIAHELGHILLGARSHSHAGLMRAKWDSAQLNAASKGRLLFSRDQALRIQKSVRRRTRDGGRENSSPLPRTTIALTALSAGAQFAATGGTMAQRQVSSSKSGSMGGSNEASERLQALRRFQEYSNSDGRVMKERPDREFQELVAEFANKWNSLMKLGDKGLWDVGRARQTRKAFERLVHSPGWVEKSKD